jgi:hypothetical protein
VSAIAFIDIPGGFNGMAADSCEWEDMKPPFFALGLSSSAFEHGVVQQLENYTAVSTVKLMDISLWISSPKWRPLG